LPLAPLFFFSLSSSYIGSQHFPSSIYIIKVLQIRSFADLSGQKAPKKKRLLEILLPYDVASVFHYLQYSTPNKNYQPFRHRCF